jgi:hypothetical protein
MTFKASENRQSRENILMAGLHPPESWPAESWPGASRLPSDRVGFSLAGWRLSGISARKDLNSPENVGYYRRP